MGLATEQEAKLVADMVARYPEVKSELLAIEESMEEFDQRNAVEPPAHLKSQIIGKISDNELRISDSRSATVVSGVVGKKEAEKVRTLEGSTYGQAKQNNFYKYAAAIAFILLIGGAWYIVQLSSMLNESNSQLMSMKGALREARVSDSLVTLMEQQLTAANKELNILKSPSMKVIELKGMEVAPDAKAMAYANTSSGEVYLEIMNLPPAPEGMQYQFWGIVDGKPVDAGMIPLEENELAGIHPMKTIPNSQAYAISLEPKGGSQQPQGKIYVMGTS